MNDTIRFKGNFVNLFIHLWGDGTIRFSLIDETGYQIEKTLDVDEVKKFQDWARQFTSSNIGTPVYSDPNAELDNLGFPVNSLEAGTFLEPRIGDELYGAERD